ncbi:hypothetical protein ACFL1S_09025 [Pseudomonadota bacterium]
MADRVRVSVGFGAAEAFKLTETALLILSQSRRACKGFNPESGVCGLFEHTGLPAGRTIKKGRTWRPLLLTVDQL